MHKHNHKCYLNGSFCILKRKKRVGKNFCNGKSGKPQHIIKKSFICTGIIYDKNKNEGLFTAWQKMQDENPIIENDLANDYEEIKAIQEDMVSDN